MKYINQQEAVQIDVDLLDLGYTLSQLMELAGLACAQALQHSYPDSNKILVLIGPGNNGGDGFVAARHLAIFGYKVSYCCPKNSPKFAHLEKQALIHGVNAIDVAVIALEKYDLIVDALFGFSFKGLVRNPFIGVMEQLKHSKVCIASIDIPSGWNVEMGNIDSTFEPAMVISLTAPKLCMQGFAKRHYLAGRFIPDCISIKYELNLPPYKNGELFQRLE